ncbi:MAG TPA: HEAT repeat domain-containing protein [Gemmatimonadaceae bacterium]|nr:HEAT repeat domain-containing protein [Gemmatimonadaceae bacterium]
MTFTALVAVSVAQLLFAILLSVFIFVHRRTAERRAREEARGLAALQGPVREWLVGEGSAERVREGLSKLPADTARYTALRIGRHNVAVEVRQEFAVIVRDAPWVRDGLQQIGSAWWWRRLEAARLLADLGTSADETRVRTLLRDPHPAVRAAATSCLRRIASPAVIDVVLDELPAQPLVVRSHQMSMLREQWELTRTALIRRLGPEAPVEKLPHWVNVAEVLEMPDVLARVIPLHAHPVDEVRIAVARALKKYFHPDAIWIVREMLEDPDWRVRAQAARSAGVLRDPSIIDALEKRLSDSTWWVRFRSSLALAQLGEPGRAALRNVRNSSDPFAAQMAVMVSGLSAGSIVELIEG